MLRDPPRINVPLLELEFNGNHAAVATDCLFRPRDHLFDRVYFDEDGKGQKKSSFGDAIVAGLIRKIKNSLPPTNATTRNLCATSSACSLEKLTAPEIGLFPFP